MKYRLAIFDMDGTILNTIEDLTDTLNYCLDKFEMPQRSVDEVKEMVGNGIRRTIELGVPKGTSQQTIDKIFDVFIPYYKEHCAIKTRPYEGIKDAISNLRKMGIKTAVVSNKADASVKDLCRDYFPGLFDYSVGDKEGQRRKPYPDSVFEVLRYFDIPKEEAVYIGDSDVDYKTALNAELDVIMVGWGFKKEEFILSLGAKEVIHSPEEICQIIVNSAMVTGK